jgi:hypothetical protein
MAKIIGDVCFPLGTFNRDGEEKTRWGKCGILMQRENGSFAIKMDMYPAAVTDQGAWFSVFEKSNGKPQAKPAQEEEQDDIPF